MKTMLRGFVSVLILCQPVIADTGARQDDSYVLVWAFLGLCALIVFLQLVPVVSLAWEAFRGLDETEDGEELEPVVSKYR